VAGLYDDYVYTSKRELLPGGQGQTARLVYSGSGIWQPIGGSSILSGNGSSLNNLNANSIASGTLSDARLSANVALRAGGNTFSGQQHFTDNVGIGTDNPTVKLHVVGEVTCTAVNLTSDRNAKERFKPVDPRSVLERVTRLSISEWQYKEQADARHIGPMAQDFREAFGLGRDEKHIASVDADGVALAAIQGLNQKLEELARRKDARIDELERTVEELKSLIKQSGKPAGGER
jgi:hypothetical protein